MSKKKFTIGVREVHVQLYEVIAEDKEQAYDLVQTGEADLVEDGLEYSHEMDREHYSVEHVSSLEPESTK